MIDMNVCMHGICVRETSLYLH